MRISTFALVAIYTSVSGCCPHGVQTTLPKAATTRTILDMLKDELALFASTTPPAAPTGRCIAKGSSGKLRIFSQTATLTLKLVGTDVDSPSGGVAIPIGSILTVDAGYTRTYTRVSTQQLTLDLNIDHSKSIKEIRADMEALEKEIESDKKFATDNNIQISEVTKINQAKLSVLKDEFGSLIAAEANKPSTLVPFTHKPEDLSGHPLARALYSVERELLGINHDKSPCLTPNTLKIEIDFQVTKKDDATGKLDFVVVSVGAEHAHTDDLTQSLVVTFQLTNEFGGPAPSAPAP